MSYKQILTDALGIIQGPFFLNQHICTDYVCITKHRDTLVVGSNTNHKDKGGSKQKVFAVAHNDVTTSSTIAWNVSHFHLQEQKAVTIIDFII